MACDSSQITTPWQGIQSYFSKYNISVQLANTGEVDKAVNLAQNSDYTIYFVGASSSEGSDRGSLSLPSADNQLISKLAGISKKFAVVIHNPGAVLLPWIDQVKSVIAAFYPGQESGNAIAQILLGKSTPKGKLPVSFPRSETGYWANTPEQYPGVNKKTVYSEKLQVGYRYYDANPDKEQALFPFGHGLTYTSFFYDDFELANNNTLRFRLTNTGSSAGQETTQLYVGYPKQYDEPPKILKGFVSAYLAKGASTKLSYTINSPMLTYWSVEHHQYETAVGDFNFMVGSSSKDIRLQMTCNFNGTAIVGCYN